MTGLEIVGVVLHQAGSAGKAGAHDAGDAHQGGRLPVAFRAEAVALGHEPLHREAGQLAQRSEVFEIRGERTEAALFEERSQAQLDRARRSAATRAAPRPPAARARPS